MTRMQKYAKRRLAISIENTIFYLEHPKEWVWLKNNQKKIKKMEGCKH